MKKYKNSIQKKKLFFFFLFLNNYNDKCILLKVIIGVKIQYNQSVCFPIPTITNSAPKSNILQVVKINVKMKIMSFIMFFIHF